MIKTICQYCNNEFTTKKKDKNRIPKFCNSRCYGDSLKLNKRCKLCDKIIENKHSVSLKNRIYCSRECSGKVRQNVELSSEWKQKLSLGRKNSDKCKKENLYNWKGGKETRLIRNKQYLYKRKSKLVEEMPIEFLNKMFILQNRKCFYCETDLTNYKAIEHLTPIKRGGDNQKCNLVYSCRSCNSKKHTLTLEEYSLKNKKYHLIKKWENLFIEAL